jgi:hypothetical protein
MIEVGKVSFNRKAKLNKKQLEFIEKHNTKITKEEKIKKGLKALDEFIRMYYY